MEHRGRARTRSLLRPGRIGQRSSSRRPTVRQEERLQEYGLLQSSCIFVERVRYATTSSSLTARIRTKLSVRT